MVLDVLFFCLATRRNVVSVMLGAIACVGRHVAYLLQIDYGLATVGDSVSELRHTPTFKTPNTSVNSHLNR